MFSNENFLFHEITPLTMAVLPENDETGALNTLVLEESGEYVVHQSPTKLIDLACKYFGSSLQGRLDGTREVSRITHKAPIAIDPSTGMFFFPTTSPKNKACSWINHSHVDHIKPVGKKKTKIVFNNGKQIVVDISYGSMLNQLQRTAQFRYSLEQRMKHIQIEIESRKNEKVKKD